MTLHQLQKCSARRRGMAAMTMVELMVGIGVGSVVLAIVSILTVFGARSFASMGNYTILEQQSAVGIDQITRELRQACGVVDWQTNALPKWLTVTNPGRYTVKYSLDTEGQITRQKSTQTQPDVLLTGCDSWTFSLLNGAPRPNGDFIAAANKSDCKMISMSWRCSRFMGKTNSVTTEAVQTARIVMRNKK